MAVIGIPEQGTGESAPEVTRTKWARNCPAYCGRRGTRLPYVVDWSSHLDDHIHQPLPMWGWNGETVRHPMLRRGSYRTLNSILEPRAWLRVSTLEDMGQ